jgi:hypothetical protein
VGRAGHSRSFEGLGASHDGLFRKCAPIRLTIKITPDHAMMRLALDEAAAAAARGETPVGAVILDPKTGEVSASPAMARSRPMIRPPTPRSR